MRKKIPLILLVLSAFSSCYYDNFDEIYPAANLDTSCDTLSTPSYSGMVEPIMADYCTSCHNSGSASGGVVLDNYSDVSSVALSGKLLGSVTHDNNYVPMPPNSSLDPCRIRQIELWIASGTADN